VSESIDWIGTYWEPSQGNRSVDLNGNGQGSISQVIKNLIVGVKYVLSFDTSGNTDGLPTVKSMRVKVSDGVNNFTDSYTFDTAGSDIPTPMNWKANTFTFTATDTEMELLFASGDGGAYGMALDNVSIAAVPLPAAGLLLVAGLGGLAMVRRRKA
jgi:choice-of-anchor C domain-containing protein